MSENESGEDREMVEREPVVEVRRFTGEGEPEVVTGKVEPIAAEDDES